MDVKSLLRSEARYAVYINRNRDLCHAAVQSGRSTNDPLMKMFKEQKFGDRRCERSKMEDMPYMGKEGEREKKVSDIG